MDTHIIAYDLYKANEDDYQSFIESIQAECPDSFEIQRSVWIVGSNKSNFDLAKSLGARRPNASKDKLFVSSYDDPRWYNIDGLKDFLARVKRK